MYHVSIIYLKLFRFNLKKKKKQKEKTLISLYAIPSLEGREIKKVNREGLLRPFPYPTA